MPYISCIRRTADILLCLTLAYSPLLQAQNYDREERLAKEIGDQLVVGEAVRINASSGKAFLGLFAEGKNKQPILLIHGVGTHPDFGVIGQLRWHLNDLGYPTLSIQMPVQGRNAKIEDYYPTVFGDAKDRISRAAAWLRDKGYEKPVILTHTMGSWMVNEYLDQQYGKNEFAAWVCMSLTGSYSWTTRSYSLAILDVFAENDIPVTVSTAWRRKTALLQTQSRQFQVLGAEREYNGKERALAAEISGFISSAVKSK